MTEKTRKPFDLDLLEELESQKQSNVQRMRLHERLTIRTKVILQPANTTDAMRMKIQGLTCDLSLTGCRAVFPVGVMPGDVYRLIIELEDREIPLVFGRCLRCRMINDSAFEAAFSFFNRIEVDEERLRSGARGADATPLL
ncbi:MAG: PilZ domain-containing protein [Planctomycetes bacterium]|nr:PilZ domain-containing protein [Planctomycetota bacterium]